MIAAFSFAGIFVGIVSDALPKITLLFCVWNYDSNRERADGNDVVGKVIGISRTHQTCRYHSMNNEFSLLKLRDY